MSAADNKSNTASQAPPRAQNTAAKVDLSAGLLPKKKRESPVDLTAGLVSRGDAAAPNRRASAAESHSARGSANQPADESAAAEERKPYAPPPQAHKLVNPLRDVVRHAAMDTGLADEPVPQTPAEPRVLAVDGEPQGTWQSPSSAAAPRREPPQQERRPQPPPTGEPDRSPLWRGRETYSAVPPAEDPVRQPAGHAWQPDADQLHGQFEAAATELTVPRPAAADTQANVTARMTGLKNLIESLGLKNAQRAPETYEAQAEPSGHGDPAAPRPVYGRPAPSPAPASVRRSEAAASPTLVTAPPEILPPKPLVEKTEKEQAPTGNGTSRRDRRETFDDVEILPSWRGQYKRK